MLRLIAKNALFSTSASAKSMQPHPIRQLTRRAKLELLRKMKAEKEKHGDKFALLEKYRRYPGMPGYSPPPSPPKPRLLQHFYGGKEGQSVLNPREEESKSRNAVDVMSAMPSLKKDLFKETATTKKISASLEEGLDGKQLEKQQQEEEEEDMGGMANGLVEDPLEKQRAAYNLLPEEVSFLLEKLPLVYEDVLPETATPLQDRVEMMRRIISLDNASAEQIKRSNKLKAIALLKQHETDIGNPAIQAVMMSIKIMAMQQHLETNPRVRKNDDLTKRRLQYWQSKRRKMLQYMKRVNIEKYVEVCKLVGVDPGQL